MQKAFTHTLKGTLILLLLLSTTLLLSCKKPKEPTVRRYELKGDIVEVDARSQEIVVRHEDIPGFMKAMTMSYKVAKPAEFEKLKPGQRIRADLVVTDDFKSWLENIRIEQESSQIPPEKTSDFHFPEPGERVPNFTLVDQDGRRFKLYQRLPALVTFIYTQCPLPDYCPRMNSNFQRVLAQLGGENDLPSNLNLISVSFDVEHDTPAELKAYRERWANSAQAKRQWTFSVPEKHGLDPILRFFGMTAIPEEGIITHSLSTTLISPEGTVIAWWHGNEWSAEDVKGQWIAERGSTRGPSGSP
jgi:protein SCO1/2